MWGLYTIICFTFISLGKSEILIFDGDLIVDEFADTELTFSQPIGRYGMRGKIIQGHIVSADPLDACTNISKPPITNKTEDWIVLIEGSYCDYHTKVKYAEFAGYSAAVIYSHKLKEDEAYINHFDGLFNISAVSVRYSSGIMIKENYLYTINKRFRIVLIPSPFHSKRLVFTAKFLLLLTTAVFIIIFFAVPLAIVKYIQHSSTYYDSHLSSNDLRHLQVSTYRKGSPYETCAICLEDFKAKDKLRILPCAHGYHVKCIDPWLTKSRRICPICKQKVVVSGDLSRIDESDVESHAETAPLLNNVQPIQTTNYHSISAQNVQPSCNVGTMTHDDPGNNGENSV